MPQIGNIKGPAGPAGPAGTIGPQGIQGPSGVAGTPGATWYTGTTTPANTLGIDNDLFLNTTTGDVLKKVAGSW